MSAPVGRETPARRLSTYRRKTEALARRPAPVVEAGGSRPWIILANNGQTIVNNSLKFMRFDEIVFDPALVTDPQANLDDVFRIRTRTEDAFDYFELETKVEGWYTVEYLTRWGQVGSSPPATPGYAEMQITFNTSGIPVFEDRTLEEAKDWPVTGPGELEIASSLELYRTIWLPANKLWDSVKARQLSGASRDLNGHLKVWYEAGNFGGSGDNASWTFENV